jgi:hypothetical protein
MEFVVLDVNDPDAIREIAALTKATKRVGRG